MKKILLGVWICLCSTSLFGQINEVPRMGLKWINPWIITDYDGSYYFATSSAKRIAANADQAISISLVKSRIASHQIVASVHTIGDTLQIDSTISPFQQLSCYHGSRIFLAYNRFYHPDSLLSVKPYSSIVLTVLDTNLNIIVPERRLKFSTIPSSSRFLGCTIQSFVAIGNKLILGYNSDDTVGGGTGQLSSFLIIDEQGTVLKDTIIGVAPNIQANKPVLHQLEEIIPCGNNRLLVTGTGIIDSNASRDFLLADTNMNILNSYSFPISYSLNGISGYYGQFQNSVVLPTGSVISGRDFEITAPTSLASTIATALVKFNKASQYAFDTMNVFLGMDNDDGMYNSNPSLHNLEYNQSDNRIYYSNSNRRVAGYLGDCNGSENFIQVVCTDTNLHTYWRKFLTPSPNTCSFVTRVTVSNERTGVDIIGQFVDGFDHSDTSHQGAFLFHIDSTGDLAVPNQKPFTLRDRFRIYPNPATDIISIDDILNGITAVDIYDVLGNKVYSTNTAAKAFQISVGEYPPGVYLIHLSLKDGSSYCQKIIRR